MLNSRLKRVACFHIVTLSFGCRLTVIPLAGGVLFWNLTPETPPFNAGADLTLGAGVWSECGSIEGRGRGCGEGAECCRQDRARTWGRRGNTVAAPPASLTGVSSSTGPPIEVRCGAVPLTFFPCSFSALLPLTEAFGGCWTTSAALRLLSCCERSCVWFYRRAPDIPQSGLCCCWCCCCCLWWHLSVS